MHTIETVTTTSAEGTPATPGGGPPLDAAPALPEPRQELLVRGHPALAPILAAFEHHHPGGPVDRIAAAFELADGAHAGQLRRSGEPYITHPLAVAQLVAELGLDEVSVCAALCHDTVEDCDVTLEEITALLGEEVAFLVDGVTKLDRLKAASAAAAKAGTIRKLLVALARDVRVLIIKLCDRLHNMRTLGVLPPEKAQRIATETLEVYAPLAHRLGMGDVKWQLEDLSFAALHPERYEEVRRLVAQRSPDARRHLEATVSAITEALAAAGINAVVSGRSKHLWSVYEKMVLHRKAFDEIHDLMGIRIVVDEVGDCYGALGVVHSLWTPVPGRFKDYIATPKFNLYQSLHVTVRGLEHKVLEVQIRTKEMHARAEQGVAAHWSYKAAKVVRPTPGQKAPDEPAWLRRLLDWHAEADDPDEFMAGLRADLEVEEIVAFTPRGDMITLPAGATSLDFAYAVHTEVGHKTVGAKVNGRLVPLATRLATGDTVEVMTTKDPAAGPKYAWLSLVTTPRARSRIRSWLTKERREDLLEAGRADLERALRTEGLPSSKLFGSDTLLRVAQELKHPDVDSLCVALAENHLSAKTVATKVRAALEGPPAGQSPSPRLPAIARRPAVRPDEHLAAEAVSIEGLDDVLVTLAGCCAPVPGDDITGYVTRGRGVSIHRTDCVNAATLSRHTDRCIDVAWSASGSHTFIASVEVEALDRPGLLAEVATRLTEAGVDIRSCSTETGEDQVARQHFAFVLADVTHLDQVMMIVRGIDGVYEVRRSTLA